MQVPSDRTEKKQYNPPKFFIHGTLKELTQGTKNGDFDNGHDGSKGKT